MPKLSEADNKALADAKELLRDAVRRLRATRDPEQRAAADHARFEKLRAFIGDPKGQTIATYLSIDDEPGTLELISWAYASGARVLLPVLTEGEREDGKRLPNWAEYAGPDSLRTGLWNIPEPSTEPLGAEGLEQATVIICSGLAGTEKGDRLGVGGGWFDRARSYAQATPALLLLNDEEVMPTLPVQEWDCRVDVIITPTKLIGCHNT